MGLFSKKSRRSDGQKWDYNYSTEMLNKVLERGSIDNDSPKFMRKEFHSLLADIEPRFQNIENSRYYGAIGPQTKKIVTHWQEKFGITADGEAGPATIYAMELARVNGGEINNAMIKAAQEYERILYGADNPHLEQKNVRATEEKEKTLEKLVSRDDVKGLAGVSEVKPRRGHSNELEVIGRGKISGYGVGCNGYEGKRHANADTYFGPKTFNPYMPIVAVPIRDMGVEGKPQPGDIVQLNYNGKTTYAVAYDIGELNNKRGTDPRDFDLNASVLKELGIKYKETGNGAITAVYQPHGAVTAKVIGHTETADYKKLERGDWGQVKQSRELRGFAKNMLEVVDDLRDKNVSPAKAEAVVTAKINEFYAQRPELAQAVGREGGAAQYLASTQSQDNSRTF